MYAFLLFSTHEDDTGSTGQRRSGRLELSRQILGCMAAVNLSVYT